METFFTFVIAAGITFFFVRGYLKKLTAPKLASAGSNTMSAPAAMSAPVGNSTCPRCNKAMAKSAPFCPHCGAAMSMWTVHRAKVQAAGTPAAQGQARPVINASLCVGCATCVDACPETGALAMVEGKAILANPDRCTGHATCKDVCPTQAIALAFGGVLQTIKVPNINDTFESNVPGLYIVGELGGMGLIKTSINEGKIAMDNIRRRLKDQPTKGGSCDVLVVGAGPAGLSASLTAHQHELNYVTLEQGEIASTIRQYPRHKFLMAEPVEMPLYGNLYVGDGTKEHLLAVWETIVTNTGVRIQTNERLEQVQRTGSGFIVQSTKGTYNAHYVVLALGKRGTPRRLGVPGEELSKVAYRLIEAEDYEGKHILVVGGGDSAIEAALALSRSGRNIVTLCHRGEDFRRSRERNRAKLEKSEASNEIRICRSAHVLEISEGSVKLESEGSAREILNDFVFVLVGGESPEDFLRKTGIEILEKALSAESLQPEFQA